MIAEAVTHDGTISAIRRTELPRRLLCGKTQGDGQEHKTGENGGGFHKSFVRCETFHHRGIPRRNDPFIARFDRTRRSYGPKKDERAVEPTVTRPSALRAKEYYDLLASQEGATAIGHRPVMKRENPTNYILFIGMPKAKVTNDGTGQAILEFLSVQR